jgi:hypothetical protein
VDLETEHGTGTAKNYGTGTAKKWALQKNGFNTLYGTGTAKKPEFFLCQIINMGQTLQKIKT